MCYVNGVSGQTAERALREFLAPMEQVNANDEYVYHIACVAVFGSFLTGAERLSDVDIMHQLERRESDWDRHQAHCNDRIAKARRQGRELNTIMREVMWPRNRGSPRPQGGLASDLTARLGGARKVLTPNDFSTLAEVPERLLAFQQRYEAMASPFRWECTRDDLANVLQKLDTAATPAGVPCAA